jgi:hypothetical protein
MSLTPDKLQRLYGLGLSEEQLKVVILMLAEESASVVQKREKSAARKRRQRSSPDLVDIAEDGEQRYIDAAVQEEMSHGTNDEMSRVTKEIPPIPPKENTSSLRSSEVNYTTLPRAREPEPLISEEAREMAEAIGREAGFDPIDTPPGWCGAANYLQAFLNSGLSADHVRVACTTVLRRRHAAGRGPPEEFSYFRKPVAEICADLSREAPKVESRALEIIDGGKSNAGARAWRADGRSRNHGSATDAASDLRQYFARRAEAEQREAAGNDCDKGGIADGRVPP